MQSYIIRTHHCEQGSENDSRIGALWLLHFCHPVIILTHCICREYDTFGTVEAVSCFIKETHTETPDMLLLYISVYAYFAFHVVCVPESYSFHFSGPVRKFNSPQQSG